jgi:hypothetical protein
MHVWTRFSALHRQCEAQRYAGESAEGVNKRPILPHTDCLELPGNEATTAFTGEIAKTRRFKQSELEVQAPSDPVAIRVNCHRASG